jgi:hypothetical protein
MIGFLSFILASSASVDIVMIDLSLQSVQGQILVRSCPIGYMYNHLVA